MCYIDVAIEGSCISDDLCMSPCSSDYIFAAEKRSAWRVVSEDSRDTCESFLLITCTGRIFTRNERVPPDTQAFQHIAKFY